LWGGAVIVALTPFGTQAQTCANGSQTPLTKSRLDKIATSQGISLTTVIRKISNKTVAIATNKEIGVWHSIACEVGAPSGNLQLGETIVRNPIVYIQTGRFPTGYGGPGSIGRI